MPGQAGAERLDKSALADPGNARNTDPVRCPAMGQEPKEHFGRHLGVQRVPAFDQGDRAAEHGSVSRAHTRHHVIDSQAPPSGRGPFRLRQGHPLLRSLRVPQRVVQLSQQTFCRLADHRSGREDRGRPRGVERIEIVRRDDAADDDHDIVAPKLAELGLQLRHQSKMSGGQ